MSIDAEIARLSGSGDLTFLSHTLPGVSIVRDVFIGEEVKSFFDMPSPQMARVSGRARAKLDYITGGGMFVFGMHPVKKSPTCLVARNAPPGNGIVDIRVSDPNPGVRLFGGLAKLDVLVLLTLAPRQDLNFAAEIARCRAEWDALFPNHPPIYRQTPEEYFSNVIPG